MSNMTDTQNTKCTNCQMDDAMENDGKTFADFTQQQRNSWMMWGCFCTEAQQQEAMAYMRTMTQ